MGLVNFMSQDDEHCGSSELCDTETVISKRVANKLRCKWLVHPATKLHKDTIFVSDMELNTMINVIEKIYLSAIDIYHALVGNMKVIPIPLKDRCKMIEYCILDIETIHI